MKTFILFIFIASYHPGGAATAEFSSLEKCEAAIEKIKEASIHGIIYSAVCLEK